MSVISYKCPNCDGDLRFDPAAQKYKCEYCFSLFSEEELAAIQQGMQDEQEHKNENEAVIFTCPSCGAEIVTEETTAATFCYYCHNPVVLTGRLSGEFLPDQVIPFAIDKETAIKKFLEHVQKKKFIPKAFFNKKQMESMTGVYFPYWMYDCDMKGTLEAEGTKIRIWMAGEEEFTETKFYHVAREGNISLKNLTREALRKANHVLAEGILPYNFAERKPFSMGYLSGFLAEKRDIEKDELQQAMEQEMQEYGKDLLRETINGYNGVTTRNCTLAGVKGNSSYVLLPVWTVTYKGRNGKIYYYSMNGQTGKICGELPIAQGRIAVMSMAVGVAAFLLALLGGYFL